MEALFNRFNELTPIAEGGTAIVYRAFDTKEKKYVAFKLLNPTLYETDKNERIKQEFSILSSLRHPNIVGVFELFEDITNRHIGFSMELLEGVPLEQARHRFYPEIEDKISFLKHLAATLSFVHEQGFIFCDLSPYNVIHLTVEDGTKLDPTAFKLVDFGIARPICAQNCSSNFSTKIGTGFFISPEQLAGSPLDQHTDVYAFGVLAYYLLTGVIPYKDDDLSLLSESKIALQVAKIPLLREKNSSLSERTEKTVAVCMQKFPSRRYDQISDVIPRLTLKRPLFWRLRKMRESLTRISLRVFGSTR